MQSNETFRNNSVVVRTLQYFIPILKVLFTVLYNLANGFSIPLTFANVFELFFAMEFIYFYKKNNKNRVLFLLGIVIGGELVFESYNLVYNIIINSRQFFPDEITLYWVGVILESLICAFYYAFSISLFVLDIPPINRKKVGNIVSQMYIFISVLFLFQILIQNYALAKVSFMKTAVNTLLYLNTIGYVTLCMAVVTKHGTSDYRMEQILDHYQITNAKDKKKIK